MKENSKLNEQLATKEAEQRQMEEMKVRIAALEVELAEAQKQENEGERLPRTSRSSSAIRAMSSTRQSCTTRGCHG